MCFLRRWFRKFIISSNCPTGPKEILQNGKYGLFKVGDHKSFSKIYKYLKEKKSLRNDKKRIFKFKNMILKINVMFLNCINNYLID